MSRVVAIVLVLAFLACGSFVGPATAPDACPVRCRSGMCCGYDEECVEATRECRPGPAFWSRVGGAKDAGADK